MGALGAIAQVETQATIVAKLAGATVSVGALTATGSSFFTGGLNLTRDTSAAGQVALNTNRTSDAFQIDQVWQNNGIQRWVWRMTTAETGSNAGSDMQLIRRDDAGTTLGTFLTFTRSTGATTYSVSTDASAVGTASVVLAGGIGVAKRAYLGTIGSTFAGNVIAGVQNGTAAVSGQIGEVISSTVSAVALAATGTVGNVTSITLTPGDWDIAASVVIAGGATGLTSGSTAQASIVTTTATNGTAGSTMTQQTVHSLVANGLAALTPPMQRINISTSTTYFLTVQAAYTAGSPTASAIITARRKR